jgi:hypothetical protein
MGVSVPVEPPVVVEPSTTLVNPSFEGGWYRPINEWQIPVGWTAFCYENATHFRVGDPTGEDGPYFNFRPEFKAADGQEFPGRSHGGRYAAQWFKIFAHHRAGLWQQVKATGRVTFSAWFSAWCSQADDPMQSWDKAIEAPDGEMVKATDAKPSKFIGRVGIDPTGGTDPWAASVKWSEPVTQCDVWSKASVTADCEGVVTAFVLAEPEWPFKHTDCYVDDCSLAVETPLPSELTAWLAQLPATIKAVAERGYVPLGMERAASEGGYWGLGYRDGHYWGVRVKITAAGLEYVEERDLGGKQVTGQ